MDYAFDEIREGMQIEHAYKIDETVYRAMISVFHDKSPIHVDEDYAIANGFSGRVVHGAVLQGFLSHFIGMRFPGKRSLILTVNINYHQPSYLGDEIIIEARVTQKVEAHQVIVLQVKFVNRMSQTTVASGKVHVAIRDQ